MIKILFEDYMSRDMTKPIKLVCTQRSLWSESSLCAQWVAKDPSFLHGDSEDSDQTGQMPRLIWVFAGRTAILLVLSCRGSYNAFFPLSACLVLRGRPQWVINAFYTKAYRKQNSTDRGANLIWHVANKRFLKINVWTLCWRQSTMIARTRVEFDET